MQIGSALEAVFLALALADKINWYKKEKETAQLETVNALEENERILHQQNIVLEKKVKERTIEIEKQNTEIKQKHSQVSELNEELNQQTEEIQSQADFLKEANNALGNKNREVQQQYLEISKQKNLIEQKNKHITASIYYAKRIQTALLQQDDSLEKYLSEYFIYFKPRDIVSGDFYWIKKLDKWLLIAVADCTGHGVPGAFMSMLGIASLNEIVRKKEVSSAAKVLDELRVYIKSSLHQTGKKQETKDGMDISFCAINTDNKQLQFAGAYNPVYIIRNNELITLPANKMPIGIHYKAEIPFTNNTFQLQSDDLVYLFTDGFIDQFGGEKGRKYLSHRFKEMLLKINHKSLDEQKLLINEEFNNWKKKNKQIDDILIVGLKI